MKTLPRIWLYGSAALGALAWASTAVAQGAPAATAQGSGGAALEEVVVTAQRRTENLQQTPVAVTALSPEAMEQRNVQNTQDLMQVTPGLQVSTQTAAGGGGSATFFLRGMGQQRSGNGSEPAVGVYVDDFYYPSLQGAIFSVIDLQQVEVLRGPQGTLFGRNTIGGAIRYTSRKPEFDFGGYVQGTLGSYDRRDISGVANIPLSDKAAVRITLGSLHTDGYVEQQNGGRDAAGAKTEVARVQVRLAPLDDLEIELSSQYIRTKYDGFAYVLPGPISPRPGTLPYVWNRTPAGVANPYDNRYVSTCDFCQAGTAKREFGRPRFGDLNAVVTWQATEGLTIKSLTGWQKVKNDSFQDLDGTPLPIFEGYSGSRTEAFSQELQLNGQALESRLNWVGGLYYYHEKSDSPFPLPEGMTVLGAQSAQTYAPRKTRSEAAYVDATFKLTDMVSLIGGLRHSKDTKQVWLYNAAGVLQAKDADSFPSTTGRAGVQVQWTDDLMTYATVSTGFRGGGFNQSNGAFFKFEPEKVTSYEAGARMDLLDGRVRFNPTAFYTQWKDIQVQSVVPTSTGVFVVLQNAAKAHSYGLELEGEAALTEHLRLFGNLALLNIEYDSLGAASGITLDSHFQRAPHVTYALGAQYRTEVGSGWGLRGTVNWSWQDVQYSTPTDADALRLPSYGLLNARLELTDPGKRWTLAVFGTNLTDKAYYVGGVNYSANVGTLHYDLGRPREFGVTLRHEF